MMESALKGNLFGVLGEVVDGGRGETCEEGRELDFDELFT
jgi:hypothetical protein